MENPNSTNLVSNEDVSDQRIHSIRLDDRSGNVKYIAQIELCDKNQNTCYHTFTRNLITANPSFIVRFMDGDALIESQVVAENHKVIGINKENNRGFFINFFGNFSSIDSINKIYEGVARHASSEDLSLKMKFTNDIDISNKRGLINC